MREIKFRFVFADTETSKFVTKYVTLDELIKGFEIPKSLILLHKNQFTGLKDKNGKEIYEGDIVQSIDWGQSKRAKGIVVFEGYEWKVTPKKRGKHSTWYEIWSHIVGEEGSSVEVIGNIYESPQLLK